MSSSLRSRVEETTKLNNDVAGHMVEYLMTKVKIEDLQKLREAVEKHMAQKGADLDSAQHIESCVTDNLGEGVTSRSYRSGVSHGFDRGWEPDLHVQYCLRGDSYTRMSDWIYPVELKCNGSSLQRNQGKGMRDFDKRRKENSIKLSVNTDVLPKRLKYKAYFIDKGDDR